MGRGCCDPRAPRPQKLLVDDGEVGVLGLDEILEEVSQLLLTDEEELAAELLSRFKARNYVPPSAEKKYAAALVAEYKKHYR
ncbi:hypothetical protein [Desulfofundulus thermosubterraneus]|uniref:Uncharacterized protein n=1 Tax=Desulfofundulus thermosubterraneus DSM 16057 TaxID=1121432 RepID=A0A1M6IQU0_9FIRM|nr:hypothetical protein [Desulfofundulus thermosubterraneus]SHJ36777.1 hypothetical protein SAMN02745219_02401 [Desulfofundulus thermosubterraneus DSM 16057]